MWQKTNVKLNIFIAWFLTFNFVNIAWIFFRAKDLDDAFKVLDGMFSFGNIILLEYIQDKDYTLLFILIAFIFVLYCENSIYILKKIKDNIMYSILITLLFTFSLQFINDTNVFLYFDF